MKNFLKSLLIIVTSILLIATAVEATTNNIFQSNGNVGIGTTSPYALFSVNGDIHGNLYGSDITSSTTERDFYGRYYARNWQGQIAQLRQNATTTPAVVAWVGDSWVRNPKISDSLVAQLQQTYGNAGAGYIPFASYDTSFDGATLSTQGTWTDYRATANSVGADITDTTSSDTGTPGKKTITGTSTQIIIHYLLQPGGGNFQYNVDGGSFSPVTTANAATTTAFITITGLANTKHTLAVQITSAGTSGVTLAGTDFQVNGFGGIRVDSLGASGSRAQDWVNVNQTLMQNIFAQLNPNIIFIELGTNEAIGNKTPASQVANLTTMIQTFQAAVPNVDIVLVPPADNGNNGTYSMDQYDNAQQDLARSLGLGFIDVYRDIGPYAIANARGLYQNSTHVNSSGGQIIVSHVLEYLNSASFLSFPPVIYSPNGNVGIGTTSPARTLDISGSVQISTGNAIYQNYDTLAYGSTTGNDYFFGGHSGNSTYTNSFNTGLGYNTLHALSSGQYNTGLGAFALQSVTSGIFNTAVGGSALGGLTTGAENTAIGKFAGFGSFNTDYVSTIDTFSTFIGYLASRDSSVASTSVLTNANAFGAFATVGCSNCLILGGTSTHAVNVGIGTSSPLTTLSLQPIAGTKSLTIASSTGATDFGVDANDRIQVKAGGVVKLSSGAATVTPSVPIDANTLIMLTDQSESTFGSVGISATTTTQFTITSSNVADASIVAWFIIQKTN